MPHPGTQGQVTFRKRVPVTPRARATLAARSWGCAGEAVAAYGIPCAAMICMMSFLRVDFPRGVEAVRAPHGVAEDFWLPVFWYASLSKDRKSTRLNSSHI